MTCAAGPETAPRVVVSASAKALRAFDTCRTGFVVLHDASLAGEGLVVTHTQPQLGHGHGHAHSVPAEFPAMVAPQQPVTDIAALSYSLLVIKPLTGPSSVSVTGQLIFVALA